MFGWLHRLIFGVQPLGPNQTSWLKELESGKYQQGRGLLCQLVGEERTPAYCCLGVECNNLGVHSTEHRGIINYLGETCKAPHPVVNALGLYTSDGHTKHYMGPSLVFLNDIDKLSFKEIAALIRQDPSMYFSEPR